MPDRWDDEKIREQISDKLAERLDVDDIEVEVEDGQVTLSGSVESREMKTLVEDICDGVSGVTEVTNLLRVEDDHNGRIGAFSSFGEINDWGRRS